MSHDGEIISRLNIPRATWKLVASRHSRASRRIINKRGRRWSDLIYGEESCAKTNQLRDEKCRSKSQLKFSLSTFHNFCEFHDRESFQRAAKFHLRRCGKENRTKAENKKLAKVHTCNFSWDCSQSCVNQSAHLCAKLSLHQNGMSFRIREIFSSYVGCMCWLCHNLCATKNALWRALFCFPSSFCICTSSPCNYRRFYALTHTRI